MKLGNKNKAKEFMRLLEQDQKQQESTAFPTIVILSSLVDNGSKSTGDSHGDNNLNAAYDVDSVSTTTIDIIRMEQI